jgi:iron complex outermembrane receptor protein
MIGTIRAHGAARIDRSTFLGEPGFTGLVSDAPPVQARVDLRIAAGWTLTPRLQYSQCNPRNGPRGREEDKYKVAPLGRSGGVNTAGMDHALLIGMEHGAEQPTFVRPDMRLDGLPPINAVNPSCALATAPSRLAFSFAGTGKVDGFVAHAQNQIALSQEWNVALGVRGSPFDHDNRRNGVRNADAISTTTWQLGSTCRLGGGASLFGGYNTGFDLEPVVGSRSRDGSPFVPETSDQREAGVRVARGTQRANMSAFRIGRNTVAVPDPGDVNFRIQEGQLRAQGVEIEREWTPLRGPRLQGGYAYLNGRPTRTTTAALLGAPLGDTPEQTVTFSSRWMAGTIELRGGVYHLGRRRPVNGGPVTPAGYTAVDPGAGAVLGPVRTDAALINVADAVYYTANGGASFVCPGDPQRPGVRLAYAFGGAR